MENVSVANTLGPYWAVVQIVKLVQGCVLFYRDYTHTVLGEKGLEILFGAIPSSTHKCIDLHSTNGP